MPVTYNKDFEPKFLFFKSMLKLGIVIKDVVSKNFALSSLCLALLEQKLQRFESLFWSLV